MSILDDLDDDFADILGSDDDLLKIKKKPKPKPKPSRPKKLLTNPSSKSLTSKEIK